MMDSHSARTWAELIARRDFGSSARVESIQAMRNVWEGTEHVQKETPAWTRVQEQGTPMRATPWPSGMYFLVTVPNAHGHYEDVQVIEVPAWPEPECTIFLNDKQHARITGSNGDKRLAAFLKTLPMDRPKERKPSDLTRLRARVKELESMLAMRQAA